MNKIFVLTLTSFVFVTTGCATTSKNLNDIESKTPKNFTVPVNYIDAYSNSKEYYLRCVMKSGKSYPVTVYSNGSPVTVSGSTGDIVISSNLDREAKSATLDVIEGSKIKAHFVFLEEDENTTSVDYYTNRSPLFGLLRSKKFRQNATTKIDNENIDLLKKVSVEKYLECLE